MKSRIIQDDPNEKTTTPAPKHLAARVGRWSVRHWKTATFGWLAFVVAAFMVGNAVKTKTLDPAKSGNGESGHVQAVLADEWKQPKSEALIVQSKHGTSHDASFRATVNGVIHELEGMPQVKKVTSPFAAGHEGMRSSLQELPFAVSATSKPA